MKIIVPLRAKTWTELDTKLDQLTPAVDLVEIWIDQLFIEFLRTPALLMTVRQKLETLKQDLDLEVLAVCKSPAEKGSFGGTAQQRVELLQAFLQLGGDYVDLDIRLNHKDLIRQLPLEKTWCSLHDFEGVPDNFETLVREMKTINPAIYKFAVTPRDEIELSQFVEFAKQFCVDKKAVFTTMGPLGVEGRQQLSEITWGTFYALNQAEKTADAQPVL